MTWDGLFLTITVTPAQFCLFSLSRYSFSVCRPLLSYLLLVSVYMPLCLISVQPRWLSCFLLVSSSTCAAIISF